MTKDEALKLALEALEDNRQTHHYCEDTWYSCPKHEDGCTNEAEGDECNCGADKANLEIDYVITAIKEALAQPEPEYLAFMDTPQRTWVGLTDCEREKLRSEADEADAGYRKLIKATEAKLKEKNT